MTTLKLTIKFIEPYRVVQWYSRERRNSIPFLRGYAFARWHSLKNGQKSKTKGRPYITGTLVRSALIRAAEELLWLNGGRMDNIAACCPGEFEGNTAWVVKPRDESEKKVLKRLRYRRRPTLTWEVPNNCSSDNPCPFCLLLGRYEKSRRNGLNDAEKNQVNFENFNVPDRKPVFLEEIADARIVNRVDQYTGKAQDFFKIWEMSHDVFDTYQGNICLSSQALKENKVGLEKLIRNAAAFNDKIAGGLCYITVDSEPVDKIKVEKSPCQDKVHLSKRAAETPEEEPYQKVLKKIAKVIAAAFEKQDKLVHLRLFSDVVRELRRYDENRIKKLPRGYRDRLGEISKHFIWDIEILKNDQLADAFRFNDKLKYTFEHRNKLRDWLKHVLEALVTKYAQRNYDHQRVCEDLGRALFVVAKEQTSDQFPSTRPLGTSQAMKVAEPSKLTIKSSHDGPCCEYLIRGDLIAQTPFYFGSTSQADGDGEHTSLNLLRTRDLKTGEIHLRLARSALRGILRRDLHIVFGTGCRAELAAKTICACPMCNLMGKITIKDSRSENYKKPPQIRHRIRLNHYKGIVDKGALFDMEIGPRGIRFPFELRIRTVKDTLPKELQTVLAWWSQGQAFLSGQAGTGKGRFRLGEIEFRCWNLQKQFEEYAKTCGGRKASPPLKLLKMVLAAEQDYPWQPCVIPFNVQTPFITKDPIASLIESTDDEAIGIDSISYQTAVVEPDGTEKKKYLLKGESLRGILRTAVGRRCFHEMTPLLEKEHDECSCVLCRLFGNEHEAGKVRVEDMEIKGEPPACRIDRVAIDRFTGGARDQHKFDLEALSGTPECPLQFEGKIWYHTDLTKDEQAILKLALKDICEGLYPLGGLGNTGYGWLNYLKLADMKPAKISSSQSQQAISFALKPTDLTKATLGLTPEERYWPHYFLPFGSKVERDNTPPPHTYFEPECHTGKLVCRLTIKTPVIIPDAKTASVNDGHKTYNFFNLNGELCIPGSEIKGMVSSVFEALTNSCLRVFDEKKRLSWRMPAENLDEWHAGRIIEENGEMCIEQMEAVRIPVYDDKKLQNKIEEEGQKGYYKKGYKFYFNKRNQKIELGQPTKVDKAILRNASKCKILLKKDQNLLSGLKKSKWFKERLHNYDHLALGKRHNSYKGCVGYVHFTGPNKIETKRLTNETKKPEKQMTLNKLDQLDIMHNQVSVESKTVISEKDGKKTPVERDRAIPKYVIVQNGIKYTMTKRCERVFLETSCTYKPRVSRHVREKFKQLCDEYEHNAKHIPDVFRTRLPKYGELKESDLIYFYLKDGEITDIIPVCISRTVDDESMGQKLRDDLRPCVRELLDEDKAQTIKSAGVKELFEQHPKGLCPTCALFGTTYYKGRVAFGFAFSTTSAPKLLTDEGLKTKTNSNTQITLPLLERPRPTWSMPKKKSKVPGRKFYVHHQGWKSIIENSSEETQNENNKTVQALAKDQSLEFEIRFENLSDAELGLLIYALQLEPELAHKLGMGKSLGFGSVAIEVKEIQPFANTKIPVPNTIQKAAKQKLKDIWEVKTDAALAEKLDCFFKLMIYIDNSAVKVRYPKLRKKDDEIEEKDGYMELKDNSYKPETRNLTRAWKSWA